MQDDESVDGHKHRQTQTSTDKHRPGVSAPGCMKWHLYHISRVIKKSDCARTARVHHHGPQSGEPTHPESRVQSKCLKCHDLVNYPAKYEI